MAADNSKSVIGGLSSRRSAITQHADRRARSTIAVPRVGLNLPSRMPFDNWLRIGEQLSMATSSSAWCLGDWLIYGEVAYTDRYRNAIEKTSLEYQTLRNYAWVARRFVFSRRRDTLSFGHHAEVAALPEPEQDFWLHKAAETDWSRNQLRREIRTSLRERSEEPPRDDSYKSGGPVADGNHDRPECKIEVASRPEELKCWEQAANNSHESLQSWATRVLNEAAREALSLDGTV